MSSSQQPSEQTVSRRDSLSFLPRPLLLRQLARLRDGNTSALSPELEQLLNNTFLREMEGSTDAWRANTPSEHFGDSCTSEFTLRHDLICGHTITTPTIEGIDADEGPFVRKLACGPNCTRHVILRSLKFPFESYQRISERPFVCPVCIEAFVNNNYESVQAEYRFLRWDFQIRELNIKYWVRHLVQRCIKGCYMRPAQGLQGVFKLDDLNTTPLTRPGKVFDTKDTLGVYPRAEKGLVIRTRDAMRVNTKQYRAFDSLAYSGRSRAHWRSKGRRSMSPKSDDSDESGLTPLKRESLDEVSDPDLDPGDALINTRGRMNKYRQRSPLRRVENANDAEMDDLADRLLYTKVSLTEDHATDSLLASFGGLMSDK
ncbi:hypothetical protein K491DRAFT_681943 [Lophiostoma macrostomum CBS 122681]|uniref:Uncharacterized protein n=1 Tax=Lophiostoma macrostomum CBS 122681 TaxID=1314788 RepID=A0A6A6SXH9_9PLEO|nr:hypothetical protein K491DRAFT_681943 [Lophiostoma macrostomum CBS 122681]